MGFQVQDGSWVQAFASPLVGNHTKMAGKEYKSKQIRGFNFCMTKSKKKKKKVWPGGEPEKVQEKLYQKEPQERWKPTSLQNSGQFCAAGFLSLSTVNMWGQIILCCEKLSWMQMGTSSCIHVPSRNNQKRLQAMPNAPRGPNLPGWELLFFITYSKYILNTSCLSDTVLATGDQKKLMNQKILALIICSSETR